MKPHSVSLELNDDGSNDSALMKNECKESGVSKRKTVLGTKSHSVTLELSGDSSGDSSDDNAFMKNECKENGVNKRKTR